VIICGMVKGTAHLAVRRGGDDSGAMVGGRYRREEAKAPGQCVCPTGTTTTTALTSKYSGLNEAQRRGSSV
jgi:hypothetical protein